MNERTNDKARRNQTTKAVKTTMSANEAIPSGNADLGEEGETKMRTPSYLLSDCETKADPCYGCANSVKENLETHRWFITMGHPGFNSTANNGIGYRSYRRATMAIKYFGGDKRWKL